MKKPREGEKAPANACATLSVHVLPRSSKEEVADFSEGFARIRLTAPPLDNRANEALVLFLSRTLGIPRRQVEFVTGLRGRRKIVRIHGFTEEELSRRLARVSQRVKPRGADGVGSNLTGKGVPEG
ncbi:MAG: DUF167 domain-containing protein [Deltaproteobacteria bacterium]|nr:DUF167 domain-containing protein [Deltaproteobacteria bacterium]